MENKLKQLGIIVSFAIASLTGFAQPTDEYGGFTHIKGNKTKQWHTEEIEGRHWLVTPEGYGIYLLGVNHLGGLNDKERKQAVENFKKWHFNVGGYQTPEWFFSYYPGFVRLSLHNARHWMAAGQFTFTDVFCEAFDSLVEARVIEVCETAKGSKRKIGYTLTDTPFYDLDISRRKRGGDWVSFIRELPAKASGKKQYVDFLKQQYESDIEKFRIAYRLGHIHSFEELLDYDFKNLELTRKSIRQDDDLFLSLIAEKMYQLVRKYFDEYQPEALLLSENFKMYNHPDAVLRMAGKYFDVISIQAGPTHGPDVGQGPHESTFDPMYWERVHELTHKPILITDHGFSFYTEEFPRTLWHQFPSEKEAADFYDSYLRQAVEVPFILGYMKCQYKSNYDPLRTLLKQGFLDVEGKPYKKLEAQLIKTNHYIIKRFR